MSAYLASYQIQSLKKYQYPREKYSYPPTTQSQVGWPWVDESLCIPFDQAFARKDQKIGYHTLEKFRFAKGQTDVFRWWGGGPEAINILKKPVERKPRF